MFDARKMKIDSVLEFRVDEELLGDRVEGRRIHEASGRSYHIKFNPPKVEGKDDVTQEDLIQRKDDNEEALKTRLTKYHEQKAVVVEYYRKKGVKVYEIDASVTPEQTWKSVE